ncbi:MAG TPA: hypothetical protein PKZ73_05080, partial [Methanomassiliicoccales archaeon]|nr:hypothetical protein [Methanomassiliicoccales archaeon]
HTSTRRSAQDVLPYLTELFRADREFRLAMIGAMRLTIEEVAFLLDKKVDAAEVKQLMQEAERSRATGEKAAASPPQRAPEEEKKERRPEPKGKQASLFEY